MCSTISPIVYFTVLDFRKAATLTVLFTSKSIPYNIDVVLMTWSYFLNTSEVSLILPCLTLSICPTIGELVVIGTNCVYNINAPQSLIADSQIDLLMLGTISPTLYLA